MGSARAIRVYFIFVFFFCCIALLAPTRARLASAPVLLTKANSTRGIAVESTTLLAEPFPVTAPAPFSQDTRTRITLFATNLSLLSGETAANVTAAAEDVNHIQYPLTVEYVGAVPNLSGVAAVTMRLHDTLGDVGDVLDVVQKRHRVVVGTKEQDLPVESDEAFECRVVSERKVPRL